AVGRRREDDVGAVEERERRLDLARGQRRGVAPRDHDAGGAFGERSLRRARQPRSESPFSLRLEAPPAKHVGEDRAAVAVPGHDRLPVAVEATFQVPEKRLVEARRRLSADRGREARLHEPRGRLLREEDEAPRPGNHFFGGWSMPENADTKTFFWRELVVFVISSRVSRDSLWLPGIMISVTV